MSDIELGLAASGVSFVVPVSVRFSDGLRLREGQPDRQDAMVS